MILDQDIRCHDRQCQVKDQCQRWLRRDEADARVHVEAGLAVLGLAVLEFLDGRGVSE